MHGDNDGWDDDRKSLNHTLPVWLWQTEQTEMLLQIKNLRNERDEARRELCKKLHRYPEYIAECRGWDCFKEDTK